MVMVINLVTFHGLNWEETPMADEENLYAAPEAELSPSGDAATAGGDGEGPREFSEAISTVIKLYFKSFVPLLFVSVPWAMIMVISNHFYETGVESILFEGEGYALAGMSLVAMSVSGMYFWGVGQLMVHNVYGEREVGGEFEKAIDRLLPLLGVGFLTGAATMLGAVLLIIPGLIAFGLLIVADLSVIIEEKNPIEGIRRSFELTSSVDNWSFGFAVLCVSFLVGIFLSCPMGMLFFATENDPVIAAVGTMVYATAVIPLYLCANYVAFRGLLARNGAAIAGSEQPPEAGTDGEAEW